jgi:hypothetical protein
MPPRVQRALAACMVSMPFGQEFIRVVDRDIVEPVYQMQKVLL